VKYITELPLVYTLGFMAVDKRAFNKIDEADRAIVREVMEKTYRNFDKQNLIDNRGARDALINAGLESVPFDIEEYQRIRDVLMVSTAALGEQGLFSPDLFEEMLRYAEEYRDQRTAESGPTP
jgi:TRAP-type C4-dicarboxylate transport system substrate-binding protein